MRLSSIKLSGFKSFVDPTVLHLPTNMTGIVGPNGCGKSNIIDAIRWVMGESAASRLRGDAITDVIFSGSGNRKPVGSATVELIFDNSDGTIQGEYASFNEISIKRQVSRDGQSNYFLNGGKCRRRDIIDVFLGTGLGARSYSIIEQGMISQIIEAKPEDLRLHLEEAAGISKYKERRKETESRIKSTRENLDRLNDVRQEVDKQLEHLNRQAKQAERYQKLKAEATRVEAELKALHLLSLRGELDERTQKVRNMELRIEELVTEQRAIEAQLEEEREKQVTASDHFNQVQGELYRVSGEIARVEQQINFNRDLNERLTKALKEAEQAHGELAEHIRGDREQIEALTLSLADSEPQLEMLEIQADERAEALRLAEQGILDWQTRWDTYARDSGESSRLAEVERTRLNFLDKQALDAAQRLSVLEEEQGKANLDQLAMAQDDLLLRQEELREKVEQNTALLDERKILLGRVQDETKSLQTRLNDSRSELSKARGRLSSLEALQHAALGQEKGGAQAWLDRIGLGQGKRLGEVLKVDDGFERAVEVVLGAWLDGALTDAPSSYLDELTSLGEHNVVLLSGDLGQRRMGSLAQHVEGPEAALRALEKVRVVNDLAEARALHTSLAADESVITRSGDWLGRDWVRISRAKEAHSGVLAREREIEALQIRITDLEREIEILLAKQDELKQQHFEAERARDDAQRDLYFAHRQLSEVAGQIQSEKGRLESMTTRMGRVGTEIAELRQRVAELDVESRDARARLETATERMGDLEDQRAQLDGERRSLLERREDARANAREAQDAKHQIALRSEAKRSTLSSLQQSLQRMVGQLATLDSRKQELAQQLAQGTEPGTDLDAELRTYLDQRMLVDRQLIDARKALESCDLAFRALEQERSRVERLANEQREQLSGLRLEEQSLKMRADQHTDAIQTAGFEIEAVAQELPPEAEPGLWAERLAELERSIKRLEPVNLAAINEYQEQSARKVYLDTQFGDLTTALETLEGAIKKIDRETRTRFKETFDKVNVGLQELFPRLFGGGHAYLELTGEDLLDTGVSIMARPPGKRVTSITLLSGGEKALTAVALVFSIFRLNPAPFCLLDEVDAPLDEANVGRFCNMLKEMCERVQFLFVSHNKATMEAASQLCGVTMREPGVSRLVSVDLAEAAKLAGAA
ncbi:chromosome segregation protein SMC [Ahniella affigens]|uniref:Chromosome partition protein Smc n=1 Tax=Ahniella affigens TaxID=2021234 RepID=A0A2P1PQI6_9GAMM|nr:chromosome segregation protein SMC [Ahniella affigens]AVP97103.1 chromosome segregation protein SMC [Ahniella affigens]